MSYETRYTDDTHGMAEPATVLPAQKPSKLTVERLTEGHIEVEHPYPETSAAIDAENEITDEEKEAELTRHDCELAAVEFETNRMMKLAVNLLADLSKRRDFPLDLHGYEMLIAQCRMLSAHGCSEDALLQLHHIMFPESELFAPMKRFGKKYRVAPITTNVVALDRYRPAAG